MPNAYLRRIRLGGLLLLLATMTGCTAGQGFILFPRGNYLLNSAEVLRDAAPRQPQLPRELSKIPLPSYVVQPGDVLLIEPATLDSPIRFPSDQPVMPDGTIDLGRFGRPVIAGKTVEEIEAEVNTLVRAVEPNAAAVNVRLVNAQSAVYYVLGEVNAPGAFPLIGRETVLDGIMAAGGLNERASVCSILLSRPTEPNGCRVVLPICYRQIVQLGDTTTNYQLKPGDRIYVGTRTLCEQLMFWREGCECDFCAKQQCACPDPGMAMPELRPHEIPGEIIPEELGPALPLEAQAPEISPRSARLSDSRAPMRSTKVRIIRPKQ